MQVLQLHGTRTVPERRESRGGRTRRQWAAGSREQLPWRTAYRLSANRASRYRHLGTYMTRSKHSESVYRSPIFDMRHFCNHVAAITTGALNTFENLEWRQSECVRNDRAAEGLAVQARSRSQGPLPLR